jgi:methionyl-tRNA formyltransferase
VNIVFIGSGKFGLKCLQACYNTDFVHVAGIITTPVEFSISYSNKPVINARYVKFDELAELNITPLIYVKNYRDFKACAKTAKKWQPSLFIVAGWYFFVPKVFRDMSPAYGLHASLLPKYSGGAPLVWAIINDESYTGITMFKMDEGTDTGLIAGQRRVLIEKNETISTLYEKIEKEAVLLLVQVLKSIKMGSLKLLEQDEKSRSKYPQRSPEDGEINWDTYANDIDRFVRAQTKPYPGAFSNLNGRKLQIWSCEVTDKVSVCISPGTVIEEPTNEFLVSCKDFYIRIEDATYDGEHYTRGNLYKILRVADLCLDTKRR